MNIDKIVKDKEIHSQTTQEILNEYSNKFKDQVKIIFQLIFFNLDQHNFYLHQKITESENTIKIKIIQLKIKKLN